MTKYQKINTVYKREMGSKKKSLIIGDFSTKEIELLQDIKWEATEKIDGTNVRIIIDIYKSSIVDISFRGKTDDSQLPVTLFKHLTKVFTEEVINNTFDLSKLPESHTIIIYGEGYGNKIQKVGSRYISNNVKFILFDINIDDIWLLRPALELFSARLQVPIVPLIGYFTINEAIVWVKQGIVSKISEDNTLISEGLVLKTPNGLLDRMGNRIITKIKYVDFNGSK